MKTQEEIKIETELAEKKLDALIQNARTAGIDVDTIASKIMSEFRLDTEKHTKKFYKIARKKKDGDDKPILKFTQSIILPYWNRHIKDSDPSIKDIMDLLDKKVFQYYLAGIFITIHSKEIPNISKKVKATIGEMAATAVQEAMKKGLIKPGTDIPV